MRKEEKKKQNSPFSSSFLSFTITTVVINKKNVIVMRDDTLLQLQLSKHATVNTRNSCYSRNMSTGASQHGRGKSNIFAQFFFGSRVFIFGRVGGKWDSQEEEKGLCISR